MRILMESLVSYEEWIEEPEKILEKVETLGEIIIVKNNKPTYHLKHIKSEKAGDMVEVIESKAVMKEPKTLTLRDAARDVLTRSDNGEMHVSDLADQIYAEKLYTKKDGSKAHYTQVRAMCGQYPDEFITLEGNRVRLKHN